MSPRKVGCLARRIRIVVLAIVIGAIALPMPAMGGRGEFVRADLRQAGSRFQILAGDLKPYGLASINGQKLTIKCLEASGQVYPSYLLIPIFTEGVVVLKGQLPSGQTLWITILKTILGKPQMSIRTTPGEDWGWCGTGGVSFTEAQPAQGYVVITP